MHANRLQEKWEMIIALTKNENVKKIEFDRFSIRTISVLLSLVLWAQIRFC